MYLFLIKITSFNWPLTRKETKSTINITIFHQSVLWSINIISLTWNWSIRGVGPIYNKILLGKYSGWKYFPSLTLFFHEPFWTISWSTQKFIWSEWWKNFGWHIYHPHCCRWCRRVLYMVFLQILLEYFSSSTSSLSLWSNWIIHSFFHPPI